MSYEPNGYLDPAMVVEGVVGGRTSVASELTDLVTGEVPRVDPVTEPGALGTLSIFLWSCTDVWSISCSESMCAFSADVCCSESMCAVSA